jgi:hypothetical protein
MDYTEVGQRLSSGLVQGFIVAFLSLIVFLPASYVMNRFIYRGTAMRIFMGVLAGILGFGSFILLLCMRLYWKTEFKIHYFGLLPLITEAPASEVKPSWIVSFFMFFVNMVKIPLTFYFRGGNDSEGYVSTVQKLIQNFTGHRKMENLIEGPPIRQNAVYEPLFETGRELSKLSDDSLKVWSKIAGKTYETGGGDKEELLKLERDIKSRQGIGLEMFK